MTASVQSSDREPDQLLCDIADYVDHFEIKSEEAYQTARVALMDTLGCGLEALEYPECTKLLGPSVPGIVARHFARVPGTQFELDPITAAFNIGTLVRWVDFSDTWLGAEGGHPSDNLGAVLAAADYKSRIQRLRGESPITMREVLGYLIKAYEIQGLIALDNGFTKHGFDHAGLIRVASTAVATKILGGNRNQIINAVSNAWVDGQPLRVYRQAPNAGYRKSWAAGDATSRGVQLALLCLRDEMGYPTVLTDPKWGFYKVAFKNEPIQLRMPFDSFVMENILFKVAFPGCVHGQTALECAMDLYPKVKGRLDEIKDIKLWSYEWSIRVVDKKGPLTNAADRDHCLQYMVAVGLIKGGIEVADFEDAMASDPRIDMLRAKMTVEEDKRFTKEFNELEKRSCANGVQVNFTDGTSTGRVDVEYPIGHKRRRPEGFPRLRDKFETNLERRLPPKRREQILHLYDDQKKFEGTAVDGFVDLFVI
jgi:2-methylcitrate dehydratase